MASLIKLSQKWLPSPFSLSRNLTHRRLPLPLFDTFQRLPEFPTHIRSHCSETKVQSPFDSNIIRILRTEVEYQSEYAPPEVVLFILLSYCLSNYLFFM